MNEDRPCPIQFTPGYKSPAMVALLKETGSYVEGKMPPRKEKYLKNKTTAYKSNNSLHPKLSSIGRRSSTSSSSGSSTRRSSNFSVPRYNQNRAGQGQNDHVRIVQLERDNTELRNEISALKSDRRKEERERRNREDQHIARVDRLHGELEHLGLDRRNLQEKLMKAQEDYVYANQDRDRLRDGNKRREGRE